MSKYIVNSTQVPNAVIDEIMPKISDAAFKCYVLIVRKTVGWHKESDSISLSQFTKLTGKSRNTVIKCCKELENAGLIIKEAQNHKSSVYKLHQFNIGTSENITPKVVQHLNQGSADAEPKAVQKLNTQNKTKQTNQNKIKHTPLPPQGERIGHNQPQPNKKTTFNALSELINLGVDEQIAQDYLTVRRHKKSPLTQTALNGIVHQAEKAGISVNQAIETCVNRGWVGFNSAWVVGQLSCQATGISRYSATNTPHNSNTLQQGVEALQELKR